MFLNPRGGLQQHTHIMHVKFIHWVHVEESNHNVYIRNGLLLLCTNSSTIHFKSAKIGSMRKERGYIHPLASCLISVLRHFSGPYIGCGMPFSLVSQLQNTLVLNVIPNPLYLASVHSANIPYYQSPMWAETRCQYYLDSLRHNCELGGGQRCDWLIVSQ